MAAQAVRAMLDSSERRVEQSSSVAQGSSSDASSRELTQNAHPRGFEQQQQQRQQGIRLNDLEAILGDNNKMLSKLLEELRLQIYETRRDILNSLDKKAEEQHAGRGLEGYQLLNEQQHRQDLFQMKQALTSIHQEILETRREISNHSVGKEVSKDSAGKQARGQSFEFSWFHTATQNAAPAIEDRQGVNEQNGQDDLSYTKQALISIQQEDLSYMKQALFSIQQEMQVLSARQVQMSDENGTAPNLQKGRQPAPEILQRKESLAVQVQQKRNQLMAQHGTPQLWSDFQEEVISFDQADAYHLKLLARRIALKGFWHTVLRKCGLEHVLPKGMPNNALARATQHTIFTSLQTLLILTNTAFMGYETDVIVKATLEEPPAKPAQWLKTCELVFNIVFAAEVLFRIIALRGWFWVGMDDWIWNVFDVLVVGFSLLSDLLATGVNVSFIRVFRILRAVRVVRVIRVLRFFRQLRQMLFSVLACFGSLAWAFVFLAMLMLMFSIVFLQGVTNTLEELDWTSERAQALRRSASIWFGSIDKAMLALLAAVTGGEDWLVIREPLNDAGSMYGYAFIAYLLFVTVGVMNVLTGIFLSNADEFFDLDLIGQYQQVKAEAFIEQMLQLFNEIDLSHSGEFDWPTFHEALKHDNLKGFLASMSLEPTHLRLIFDLLDEKRTGRINMNAFLMAILKLKGEAKAVDCRVMLRELSMLPMLLQTELGQYNHV